ncbi:hypothetical protein HPP92_028133 [Vanilla planifolia]|uniref:Protein NO VEIN C-terminal domain-containing protein n=1 Tax=Vanilla planifolia TaxID=51239 RepID=A0A835P6M4_VANPL|nr:hypothetical protein HPP92_028133 [Vanilla planifolia]
MVEYLSFIMLHIQFDCVRCQSERTEIILELQKKPVLLTNRGYSCPLTEPVHFGKEYGNPLDIAMLLDVVDISWVVVDPCYLKHPVTQLEPSGLLKWRSFLLDLGVTDFVKVTCNEKNANIISEAAMIDSSINLTASYVRDWESPELVNLLSIFSSKGYRAKCMFLLEVLDKLWDDVYHSQALSFIISKSDGTKKPIVSSFMKCIQKFSWIPSTLDKELHQPESVFYDCEQVQSILGIKGPYACPQVNSKLLVKDIGFKVEVSIDDAVEVLRQWRVSGSPFVGCTAQMLKFYTFIANGIASSSLKVIQELISDRFHICSILSSCKHIDSVSGMFILAKEAYWQDPTGCVDRMNELINLRTPIQEENNILCPALAYVYPGLHDFFVNVCGVPSTPPICSYYQILVQLSAIALPSHVAHEVFCVMVRWASELKNGLLSLDQISELKDKLLKLENTVIPTEQDKWVSLHPSFGLLSWSDDDHLKKQFKHNDGISLIMFGDLSIEEKALLSGEVATFLRKLDVHPLSEVVSREAIFYGSEDNMDKVSLLNWVIPYAQRYLYQLHRDIYLELKQLGFEKINQLQVVIVSELFYKFTLKGHDCASKRRIECNCLLQGNVLYATRTTDAHSMYLELSRFFFKGSSDLHFANFLHMVTTMADSSSTSEQIEYFILHSQKIPKLPNEEPIWSLSSISNIADHKSSNTDLILSSDLEKVSTSKAAHCKAGSGTNWPPTSWKNAPNFHYSQTRNPANHALGRRGKAWAMGKWGFCRDHRKLEPGGFEHRSDMEVSDDLSVQRIAPTNPPKLLPRDRITWQFPNEQQLRRTGKLGEMIAFKYFSETLGSRCVSWVNEEIETGLPYDLLVGEKENLEYVEVKATSSANKDWFDITSREWSLQPRKGIHTALHMWLYWQQIKQESLF